MTTCAQTRAQPSAHYASCTGSCAHRACLRRARLRRAAQDTANLGLRPVLPLALQVAQRATRSAASQATIVEARRGVGRRARARARQRACPDVCQAALCSPARQPASQLPAALTLSCAAQVVFLDGDAALRTSRAVRDGALVRPQARFSAAAAGRADMTEAPQPPVMNAHTSRPARRRRPLTAACAPCAGCLPCAGCTRPLPAAPRFSQPRRSST